VRITEQELNKLPVALLNQVKRHIEGNNIFNGLSENSRALFDEFHAENPIVLETYKRTALGFKLAGLKITARDMLLIVEVITGLRIHKNLSTFYPRLAEAEEDGLKGYFIYRH